MMLRIAGFVGLAGLLAGCQGDAPSSTTSPAPQQASPAAASGAAAASPATLTTTTPAASPAPLPRISLGGSAASDAGPDSHGVSSAEAPATFTREEVLAALKPLQMLRDDWNGIRQKSVGGQDAGENLTWIWDHRTNPKQPALVMTSPQGRYFRDARLSYDPPSEQFLLQTTGPDGEERAFTGVFSEPVREVQAENNKVDRTYKLQFTETNPRDEKDQWRLVLNQQENNRYLLEFSRRRSNGYQRFETVSAQRRGTSFALSDTDYGEKTCVISGGLGTIQVSFQGKSYWVCCTGCQAAFNEDPARWIAEYEAKRKPSP